MEATVEEALSYLQKSGTAGGVSLYDHLSDVIGRILVERPENAVDTFEAFSFDVRSSAANVLQKPASPRDDPRQQEEDLGLCERRLEAIRREREEREDAEEDAPDTIAEEAMLWEGAGVALAGREELLHLSLSVRELQAKHSMRHARLWGKVLTRGKNDYWVLETLPRDGGVFEDSPRPDEGAAAAAKGDDSAADDSEDDDDSDEAIKAKAEAAEKKKKEEEAAAFAAASDVLPEEEGALGANRFTYWVCTRPGSTWTRLAPVTPAQITAARRVRRALTGDLSAPVAVWPAFPGTEANLLRAQIARITAATLVSPKGALTALEPETDDDTDAESLPVPELAEQEDWAGLPPSALLDPRAWCHSSPYILPQGRCTYWRAPKVSAVDESGMPIDGARPLTSGDDTDDVTGEETDGTNMGGNMTTSDEEELQPAESGPSLLTGLNEDAPLAGEAPAWSIVRVRGTAAAGKGGLVVASSNRWPGAHAAAHGARYSNVYVGFAMKWERDPWVPAIPGPPQREAVPATGKVDLEKDDPTVEEERELEERRKREEEERIAAEQAKAAAEEERRKAEEEAKRAGEEQGAGAQGEKQPAGEFDEEIDEDEEETTATESEATTTS